MAWNKWDSLPHGERFFAKRARQQESKEPRA